MTKFIKGNWLKILAIGVLVGALWNHPYSYYQVLRWFITISSAYMAYEYADKERNNWMWIFIGIAILFNPIFPFYFSKNTWQLLDLVGAVIFLISILFKTNK